MTEHIEKIDEASNYISHLIHSLGNTYDVLHGQNVELDALGQALDGLIYINTKLQEQKPILTERLAKLRAKASSGE